MASSASAHARSHSLLLLQRLLGLRDAASPLTLVVDSLEQPARPLVVEFITRAKLAGTKVILLSFETLKKPRDADVLVMAAGRDLKTVRTELLSHYPPPGPAAAAKGKPSQRAVVILDSTNSLASGETGALASFLTGIITPAVSVVAVHHDDVPIVLPRTFNEYEPHPATLLNHLATAILRISSLQQEVERQRARNRALEEPEWGLKEGREGVLVGLRPKNGGEHRDSLVIAMELRRRSGRAVSEKFTLVPSTGGVDGARRAPGRIALLADHDMFAVPGADDAAGNGSEAPESTFDLGLTEKQRKDREGIVLPYFDAQTDIGAGEGGRILYEMGREDMDDFDDEEDEI